MDIIRRKKIMGKMMGTSSPRPSPQSTNRLISATNKVSLSVFVINEMIELFR